MPRPSGRPLADHLAEYLTSRPEFVELLAPAAAAFVDFLQFCGAATKAIAQRIAELPALHRGRPRRDRLQRRRAQHPSDRAQSEERSLRGLGRRRRALGSRRLARRNMQALRRQALRLSRRRHHAHRQRPSKQPNRRSPALDLRARARHQRRGLKTALTFNLTVMSSNGIPPVVAGASPLHPLRAAAMARGRSGVPTLAHMLKNRFYKRQACRVTHGNCVVFIRDRAKSGIAGMRGWANRIRTRACTSYASLLTDGKR